LLQKKTIVFFPSRIGGEQIYFSEKKRVVEFSQVEEAESKYFFFLRVGGSEGKALVFFMVKEATDIGVSIFFSKVLE
jgi:hypothetical protein